MGNHPIDGMLGTTMEKIKEMVDVDSVIGKPITTPDGTTVIPISSAVAQARVLPLLQLHFYLFATVM